MHRIIAYSWMAAIAALAFSATAAVSVSSVPPSAGETTGGTAVTIQGAGFLANATVTFGAQAATNVTVVNDTQITCNTPPHLAGAVDVTVTNTDTTTGTLASGFIYTDTSIIMTVAGTGVGGNSGDGGPAAAAQLKIPGDVQFDASGNMYIADTTDYRIRKVDAVTGLMSTVAGTGAQGTTGDGGPAATATLNAGSMTMGPNNELHFIDPGTGSVRLLRKISLADGTIGLVQDLTSTSPRLAGFTFDQSGNIYITDWYGPARLLKRDTGGGIAVLTTVLSAARSVAMSPDGSIAYVSNQNDYDISTEGHKVKQFNIGTGILTDFAGTGTAGFSGDNGPAASAQLDTPWFVCTDADGNVYIPERGNNRIRCVAVSSGTISTIAGDGTVVAIPDAALPRGDGGPPLKAQIGSLGPCNVWQGDLYFSEMDLHKVRRITNAPYISGSSPSSTNPGATVTLTGTNIRAGAAVTIGGVAAQNVTVVSATQLTCTVPSGIAGAVAVAANNPGTKPTVVGNALTVITNAPSITSLTASKNPVLQGDTVAITAEVSNPNNGTLSFAWDFGDGATATGNPASHAFAAAGTYTVTVTANDGFTASAAAQVNMVVVAPASGSAGQKNVGDKKPALANPLNGLAISVANSDGGVVEMSIDVSGMRADYDVSTDFDGVATRIGTAGGYHPVQKFTDASVFVAAAKAFDKGTTNERGKARRTLVLSNREVGLPVAYTKEPASYDIAFKSAKGKFGFTADKIAKGDTVTLSGQVELPEGLKIAEARDISLGIGNVIDHVVLDAKGKTKSTGDAQTIKKVSVKYPKPDKATGTITSAIPAAKRLATITVTLASKGMVSRGFDTEGVDPSMGGKTLNIQVAFALAGVAYEKTVPVTLKVPTKKDSGAISMNRAGR